MTFIERSLDQRKLVLTLVVLLSALGIASWATMIRQEDPRLPDLFGQVQVVFPGADAETVERLVIEPIEEHLSEIDEVLLVGSTAWAELAFIGIDLREGLAETNIAWDRVRDALDKARREFPEGVGEPVLNDRVIDTASVVYALTGSTDPRALAEAAERLKDQLLSISGTARVEIVADPGEQITIALDDAAARRFGLSQAHVAQQLGNRSRILAGGSLRLDDQTVRLRPRTDFESLDEIRGTPIRLPGGELVPLSSIASVRRGPEEPARFRARFEGESMVGVAAVPRRAINLVTFGDEVRERIAAFAPILAPIEIHEIAFQPARVAARLSGLARSLLLGAAIVAGVLILSMGLRLGLVVTAVVPLVTLSSLAIFNLGGGVLHQISIAALVIALGMLVDNGIVVSESIQWYLDRGLSKSEAARTAVRELAAPLAAATATTLAAFVPMLLSRSTTGDFTRAVPVMVMLTLTVSFLFAMLVTPTLSSMFLKPRVRVSTDRSARIARRLSALAVKRPAAVVLGAFILVGLSIVSARWVDLEFFPGADRNQFVVELRLPEGTHLDATDRISRRLERELLARPEVSSVSAFVGRSAPRFYYNLEQIPWSPHFGQIVVETTSLGAIDDAVQWVRDRARSHYPEAEVVVRTLEQGPPVAAPVELRLFGDDLVALGEGVEMVVRELRRAPGAADVRHSLSTGAPLLRFEIDDAAAARHGLTRADVATALYGRSRGLVVGQYRADDDPVSVVLRSSLGEDLPVDDLASVDVSGPGGGPVPLAQIARMDVEWRPAAISHRGGRRVASVFSQLEEGATYSGVIRSVMPAIDSLDLPAGVEVRVGGAAEESGSANQAIIRMVPIGLILLLGILLFEFRSFRRVALVLVTVPLAAAGVVPGLILGDQPFGFMSMLGVIALVGIVVNNAIVLLEVIEASRAEGTDIPTAVRRSVERRLRPILLTTATTVAGLLPLALSESSLWPPMAWSLISGLIASTALTLLVVPALYLLLFAPRSGRPKLSSAPAAPAAPAIATGLLLLALPALASPTRVAASEPEPITLSEAVARGAERPRVGAALDRAEAVSLGARAERRAGVLPTLGVAAGLSERDRTLLLPTPIGSFPFQPARAEEVAVRLTQPLFEPARQLYAAPAALREAESSAKAAEHARRLASLEAGEAFLDVLALDAAAAATGALLASLEAGLAETVARVEAGRVLATEASKLELAMASAEQNLFALTRQREIATRRLGRAVGSPQPVEPIPDFEPGRFYGPSNSEASRVSSRVNEALAEAVERRPDLDALRERLRAAELRRKAVRAERLPSLEANASWIYSTGAPFEQTQWVEAGLALTWAPFRSGTVAPRAHAASREFAALEADYVEAVRGVELEITAALADLEIAQSALRVGQRGIAQASETLRVERERFDAGRLTTNDLLDAEAALQRETTRRDLAALDLVRLSLRLDLVLGREPLARRGP